MREQGGVPANRTLNPAGSKPDLADRAPDLAGSKPDLADRTPNLAGRTSDLDFCQESGHLEMKDTCLKSYRAALGLG
ncbi:hypothetical protein GCM10007968_13730 [Sporolactobacillus putidus]|uniref:Uncharacterized protein n=1 Tax=Sporolactobacillus putidus TaxID=492735 RepID=A0A917S1L4_9BACL|nr:hypothetical protein GCM10007968_13730 [Sporolactobacillus putidus]